jgi:hypothetical protein
MQKIYECIAKTGLESKMRLMLSIFTICLMTGCALTPPQPKQCDGGFRPVNATAGVALMDPTQSLAMCKGDSNGFQNG